ncbi:FAD binding domain-containing protein [Fusibacter sp. JL216-2]|uniref:FAD binding domain-containing protein n=1 Tax=Fusibacter sp. JL216-2 TaxID=3071453 RepID=UPI003D33DC11
MLSFNNYHKPESIDEAYDILNKNKRSQVVGGGAFLRMGNRRLTDLIDISDLGLDQIIHQENNIEIGGMTVFHKLETCPELPSLYRQYFKDALGQIVGVQLRNMVTVGGTVFSRYGFSDLNTALLAAGGSICLHKGGIKDIESFFMGPYPQRDILIKVIVPNDIDHAVFKSARLSTADYAMLNLAVTVKNNRFQVAVGARPHRALLAQETITVLNDQWKTSQSLTKDSIDKACMILSSEIKFGSNRIASQEYRRAVSRGLLKEALLQIQEQEKSAKLGGHAQ